MNNMIIGITGGIGSGKSIVSRIICHMGFPVYDCDTEARRIIDTDEPMRRRIYDKVCAEAENADGTLNRRVLATAVFTNPARLKALNAIVHSAVREDIINRAALSKLFFFESAILRTGGLAPLCSQIWEVIAPEELRIERVMRRSTLSAGNVRERIDSQKHEGNFKNAHLIVNDGFTPLLPRVEHLISEL